MAEQIESVVRSLEVTFEAARDRATDEAASDLALSLVQDRTFPQALRRGGGFDVTVERLGPLPVTVIGADFVIAGRRSEVLVPVRAMVAVDAQNPAPTPTDATLLEVLRALARKGSTAEVSLRDSHYSGRLLAAGRDHVVVETRAGRVLIAIAAIERVRLLSEGSVDDL